MTLNHRPGRSALFRFGFVDTEFARLDSMKSRRHMAKAKDELMEKMEEAGYFDPLKEPKDGDPGFTLTEKVIKLMEALTPEEMALAIYLNLLARR